MTEREIIVWIDAAKKLPDADLEVMVQYQRNDCDEVCIAWAVYDDSNKDGPWSVDGGLSCFGGVLFWAEMPKGPRMKKVEA